MKIFIIIAGILLATQITFPQIYWDENGNSTRTMEVISKPFTAAIDTGFNFVDTLRFPLGFKPRPGHSQKMVWSIISQLRLIQLNHFFMY